MRDRPYHHGDLHEALVTAGLAAAREGGPSAISIRVLAKATDVSPTAVYRHFPSLEHLVAAVSQRAREQLAISMGSAMDAVIADAPATRAWERLLASGRAYVTFATAEPNLFATAFVPCAAPPPREDAPDAWGMLVSALDAVDAAGELAELPPGAAPFAAWATVQGLASIVGRASLPPGVSVADATEAVLDVLRRGLRA
jgi:AcrR family transcriptional regulator